MIKIALLTHSLTVINKFISREISNEFRECLALEFCVPSARNNLRCGHATLPIFASRQVRYFLGLQSLTDRDASAKQRRRAVCAAQFPAARDIQFVDRFRLRVWRHEKHITSNRGLHPLLERGS